MLAALFTMAGAVAAAAPSQDSYHAVTNDWYNGNFSNVLELSSARLAANTNDLVGAYLKLSWDICFADIPTLSNSVTRAIALSDAVTNAAFSEGDNTGTFDYGDGNTVVYTFELVPDADPDTFEVPAN